MWTTARQSFPALPPTEESCPLAEFTLPTGYEPKLLDDFHYSETSEMNFQEESSDKDKEPSYLCDAELDHETIGEKALSSPLFFQGSRRTSGPKTSIHMPRTYTSDVGTGHVVPSHTCPMRLVLAACSKSAANAQLTPSPSILTLSQVCRAGAHRSGCSRLRPLPWNPCPLWG